MMRVYVPATLSDLRTLASGEPVSASEAYAATSALAAEYPDADDEELEFAAMMAAAEDCASDTAIVIATDVEVTEAASTPGVVAPVGSIVLEQVASFHVGSASDDDLAWYATQELSDLVDELG